MIRTGPVDSHTFARARAVVSGQPWLRAIERDMTSTTGRPRVHSWEAFFVVLEITIMESLSGLLLTEAARVAARLTDAQRTRIGLTSPMEYAHLESMLTDLGQAMDESVDIDTGEVKAPRLSMRLPETMYPYLRRLHPRVDLRNDNPVHRLHGLRDPLPPSLVEAPHEARCARGRTSRRRLRSRQARGQ